jgi:hypothetical protein
MSSSSVLAERFLEHGFATSHLKNDGEQTFCPSPRYRIRRRNSDTSWPPNNKDRTVSHPPRCQIHRVETVSVGKLSFPKSAVHYECPFGNIVRCTQPKFFQSGHPPTTRALSDQDTCFHSFPHLAEFHCQSRPRAAWSLPKRSRQ